MTTSLRDHHPWLLSPVIISAPMGGFAGSSLATEVTKAGGLGFIGATPDIKVMHKYLEEASQILIGQPRPAENETLPVGIGALLFAQKLESVLKLVKEFRPAAVWLFAAHDHTDYQSWSEEIRSASPKSKIWIQISSVAAAVELAGLCSPDVFVIQGIDAGGHGSIKGASIVSLLPEIADVLRKKGFRQQLVAAGGLADGRGVASALCLGASGAVMGTRFLAAPETIVHPQYQAAVLETVDGGQNTVRAKVFDELSGPNIWPLSYDGRAIVAASFTDHADGMSIDDIRKLHAEAKALEHAGFGPDKRRAAIWAGTGVGLICEITPAAQIVKETRDAAIQALEVARSRL